MTPTQTLCAAAGTTPEKAARRAGIQKTYLARCVNRGCPYGTAAVLTTILGCDPMIFVWGYGHYLQYLSSGHHGIAGSDTVDTSAPHRSDFTPCVKNSIAARRRHIPRLIKGGKSS